MTEYPELNLFIGSKQQSRTGKPVINPATGAEIGNYPVASESDVNDAITAANNGFRIWRNMACEDRAKILFKAIQIIKERTNHIAHAITLEQGKPLTQAKAEVMRGCQFIEWDTQESLRLYGRQLQSAPDLIHTTIKQAIGPVAAITAWNYPMSTPCRKIGGALSAGCSVVLKASEETPAAAYLLVQTFYDAGLPDGVLSLLFGDAPKIAHQLITDPRIRAVSFTGSIPVGRQLAQLAGQHLKPAIMELGGHGPVIICEDANVADAVQQSVTAKSRNTGQVCTSPTRFFVHQSIYNEFVEQFKQQAQQLKIGNGLDPDTDIGPLTNIRRIEGISQLVDDATKHGAKLVCGGNQLEQNGYYFPMTVLAEVPENARVMQEEPFGPIAIINPFENIDEALQKANSLPYGLAAYAFTNSAKYVNKISNEIEAGNLSFNHFKSSVAATPSGGVKDSGFGREGGQEGIHSYTITKNISHLIK